MTLPGGTLLHEQEDKIDTDAACHTQECLIAEVCEVN